MGLSWAVVPTAGKGTRLMPATAAVPKVLLPVGVRPMVDWAIEEAVGAGVGAIIVVVSPDQPAVRVHVERVRDSWDLLRGIEVHVLEQPEPRGLGDALIRCRELTGNNRFGVVVPDNWFDAAEPALAQIARTQDATGLDTIGLVEVSAERAGLLGNVGRVRLEALGGAAHRIVELGDKLPGTFELSGAAPVLRGCARYALGPGFYDALEATGPPAAGEWDDVPAFQHLTKAPGLAGHRLEGLHFDVGHGAGYLAAMAHIAERAEAGG